MMSHYNQLVIFGCDGEHANLFNNIRSLYRLPSNCECYLFWNKDSPTIT
ncbi:unnamed protein product, partial [Rotaria magnacalcarata]